MERRIICIRGTVQGVGFRPFVHSLAKSMLVGGFVRNKSGSVEIEAEADAQTLNTFQMELVQSCPVLARISEISWLSIPVAGESAFEIRISSGEGSGPVTVTADAATCDDCLLELFDACDRRFRYSFTNCTNCGPRLSIIIGVPYDRERTTMAGFEMCAACRAEYENPADRRFHAQPIACPVCGPRLSLLDATGKLRNVADPLAVLADALRAGRIGAVKGLGGYHLACDAANAAAVAELRRRKHRDEKPLAVMVTDLAAAARLCHVGDVEKQLLLGPSRPIVLLEKRLPESLPDEIAPGNSRLGVMLPYTPLHHLLLRDFGSPLVMTSGNASDEPIAYQDSDAVERLSGIADLFLIHNRPIHVRCDDSVTRVIAGFESPIRRSRGYAPQPVRLPMECPAPILAVGAQMKSTFALGRDRQAVLSQHMGDLDHFEAARAFERDITLYEELFSVRPECIAHDLHPDYTSTRYAMKRANRDGIPTLGVQHHHAHMASCMAEHGLTGLVLGVIWDGTGYGSDGNIWGGEFFVGDAKSFRRFAHLRYVGLPGGEKAVRDPWRVAVAHLVDAGLACPSLERRIAPASMKTVRQMIDRRFNTPMASSAGRLFDAVASLIGIRDFVSYEGYAAIQMEQFAASMADDQTYPFEIIRPANISAPMEIDTRPMIRAIANEAEKPGSVARSAIRFHRTLIKLISLVITEAGKVYGDLPVVLSGGVFMNAILASGVNEELASQGFHVYQHRLVPPNDGGISLGQMAVAAVQMTRV
jgi:hydrogenase maturation protein HypF